ncbi:ATP-binding protein [Sphingomonas naphthae]|uniref:ATP-binding protein n=1 Tax=Sphingomonas naphthae TaxID=1813468 RepID=A0ABY7TJ25_9SPHN|nr:ATP-binding protein [Sphingomonas naphthae]WCT73231.1 ATP-binding protein [Sphingomonas naphthae]
MSRGFGLKSLSRWLDGGRPEGDRLSDLPTYGGPVEAPRPASYDMARGLPGAMQQAGIPFAAPQPIAPAVPDADYLDQRREALTQAFNPSHPVERRRDLCGRDDKLAALFDAVLTQKKHAIVHGARGSGKTSLVRVFGDYADNRNAVVIYMACEPGVSFGELMRHYVRFIPGTSLSVEDVASFEREVATLSAASRPRDMVEILSRIAHTQVIFILDEFDRVTDSNVQGEVATFMKLLSDAHIPVQLLIVGIARSVSDIIECHPSLRRHLTAIAIGRIAREDVGLLVDQGAARAGIQFDAQGRDIVVRTSCGSPYHARLFAYQAGLEALRRGTTLVDGAAALGGLASATEQWARLNESDSALFERLAATAPAMRARLADIARVAAIGDGFTRASIPDERDTNVHLEGALEGALVSDVRDISRKIFRDSLAPQFLLATIELANAEDARPRMQAAPPPQPQWQPQPPAAPAYAPQPAPSYQPAPPPQPAYQAPPAPVTPPSYGRQAQEWAAEPAPAPYYAPPPPPPAPAPAPQQATPHYVPPRPTVPPVWNAPPPAYAPPPAGQAPVPPAPYQPASAPSQPAAPGWLQQAYSTPAQPAPRPSTPDRWAGPSGTWSEGSE